MNSKEWQKIETIVDEVLENNVKNWREYIEKTCSDNPELKSEVTKLLESIFNSEGWLESSESYEEYLVYDAFGESPVSLQGETFGAYCATELIAEGGMGAVYLGERIDDDFDHSVAIKVIKAGMGTPDNIRRFNRERSILAGLKHEGIAQLYDGGISENGLPYLIMEYVEGVRIDEYCENNQLKLHERIDLFKQVLNAVMYAHENLVIHRDLKPGNILVTNSGKVKILDFGIAKLLDEDDDSENSQNITRARILTPKYAAPEQILQSSVTTATDIYTLGVIFYDLLTGSYPFDLDGLSKFEIEQRVLESEPTKPSVKAQSEKQKKEIRGDLDAVALKAVRKKPEFRYRTVKDFMDDLNRFQEGLPVTARENTVQYRFQKFFKRHRKAVATVTAILLLIIGFLSFYTYQITQERNRAQAEEERANEFSEFLVSLFEANNPRESVGEDIKISEIIDRGLETLEKSTLSVENRAAVLATIGQVQMNIGEGEAARQTIDKAFQLSPDSILSNSLLKADIHTLYGNWHSRFGQLDDAASYFHTADSIYIHSGNTGKEEYRTNLINLADVKNQKGAYEEAITYLKRIEDLPAENEREIHQLSYYFNNIAIAHSGLGEYDKALEFYENSLAVKEQLYADDNPELALTNHNVAVVYLRRNLYQRAYELFKKAYKIRLEAFGPDHHLLGSTLSGMATSAANLGKIEEAEKYHKDSIRIIREQQGKNHYRYALALRNYSSYLIDNEWFEEAEDSIETAHQIIIDQFGTDQVINAHIFSTKAKLYNNWDKTDLAIKNYENSSRLFRDHYGSENIHLGNILGNYAIFLFNRGNYIEAAEKLKESNNILEVNGENDSYRYGRNLYYLAQSYYHLEENSIARDYLEDAYNIISETRSDTTELARNIQTLITLKN